MHAANFGLLVFVCALPVDLKGFNFADRLAYSAGCSQHRSLLLDITQQAGVRRAQKVGCGGP